MTTTALTLGGCVARIADQLAQPERVHATTNQPDTWIELGPDGRRPRWHLVDLTGGPAGIALLYAELSYHDAGYRRIAHEYLARAVANAAAMVDGGLHTGLAGIAFAARAAARSATDYAVLREKLDERIVDWTHSLLRRERRTPDTQYRGTSYRVYDVVTGLTGIGRYLLDHGQHRETVDEILSYLVELAAPSLADNVELPGWWVDHAPTRGMPDAGGHANYGLSHGIAGPLALLSLAWRRGHHVAGQDEAIGRIVTWYLADLGRVEGNPFWPSALTAAEYLRGVVPARVVTPPTWCYGAPGIARAIQLAGLALGEPAWCEAARSAMHEMIVWIGRGRSLPESMLCHGWAGLLQTLWRINGDFADPAITRAIDDAATRLLAAYDPAAPFGFRARTMGDSTDLDLPGFLEGAAGTALAIQTYLTGRSPSSGWDAALLLT